jgi:hypothetical protein
LHTYTVLVGRLEGKRPLEDLGVGSGLMLKKEDGRRELDSSGSEWGPMAGSCAHDNEPCGSMSGVESSRATFSFSQTHFHGMNNNWASRTLRFSGINFQTLVRGAPVCCICV